MQALLSELSSIPKSFQYLNGHTIILNVSQNAKYENKKRRFIKILHSVNPNLTMFCLKDTKTQILYDGKIGVRCDVYANTNSDIYSLELEFDRSLLGNYKFTNPLTFQRNVCFRNNFMYDGVDIDKLIKLYYTKKEFCQLQSKVQVTVKKTVYQKLFIVVK
jgi:hypothetical protein